MIVSNNAAVANEIAQIESGSISVRRNLSAGQFKPHKIPINRNASVVVKLYLVFKEIP